MGSQRECRMPLRMIVLVLLVTIVRCAKALQWVTQWSAFNPRTGVGIQLQWTDNAGPVTITLNTFGAESSRLGTNIVCGSLQRLPHNPLLQAKELFVVPHHCVK